MNKILWGSSVLLLLTSCKLTPSYWKNGGDGAIAFVGINSKGKEVTRYLPKEMMKKEMSSSLTEMNSGVQTILERGEQKGGWRFGQLTLGLQIGGSLGFRPIYSLGIDNSFSVIFRKREFIE